LEREKRKKERRGEERREEVAIKTERYLYHQGCRHDRLHGCQASARGGRYRAKWADGGNGVRISVALFAADAV